MFHLLFSLSFLGLVAGQTGTHHSVLEINYPNVSIRAPANGNVTIQGGPLGGSVRLTAGRGGIVYFENEDLTLLLDMIRSLPPVWVQHSSVGFYGTFYGGDRINVKLEAKDPEGGSIRYEVVAGALPVGVTVNGQTGYITGIAPDEEALFIVTIRAIDMHDKHADAVYTMETHEKNQCLSNPCVNGGRCTNSFNDFNCSCPILYGGKRCQTNCSINPLGVGNRAVIPDAQMSAHLTKGTETQPYKIVDWSYNARLGHSGNGWCGQQRKDAWLQVDLGATSRVFAVAIQGAASFTLAHSVDGATFSGKISNTGTNTTKVFNSNTGSSGLKTALPVMLETRFIRFYPNAWSSGYPCARLELYGCQP